MIFDIGNSICGFLAFTQIITFCAYESKIMCAESGKTTKRQQAGVKKG